MSHRPAPSIEETPTRPKSSKNTKRWCKGVTGREHQTSPIADYECRDTTGYAFAAGRYWYCWHEHRCSVCGKILGQIAAIDCPVIPPRIHDAMLKEAATPVHELVASLSERVSRDVIAEVGGAFDLNDVRLWAQGTITPSKPGIAALWILHRLLQPVPGNVTSEELTARLSRPLEQIRGRTSLDVLSGSRLGWGHYTVLSENIQS